MTRERTERDAGKRALRCAESGPDAGKMRGRLGRAFGDWAAGKGKEMGHEEEKGNGLGQAVSWVGLGFGFPISLVFSPLFFSKHTQTI